MQYLKAKFLRRVYLILSIFLALIAPLYCWYLIPDYNPINEPLSTFGIAEPTWVFWNVSLVFLAIGMFWNAYTSLRFYFKKRRFRYPLKMLLILSCLALIFVAAIPMNYEIYHQVSAVLFFMFYNLFVFLFGMFRSISSIKKGVFSMFIGLAMLFSLVLVLPFPSYGVFEIVYFSLILIWNISFLTTRMQEDKI